MKGCCRLALAVLTIPWSTAAEQAPPAAPPAGAQLDFAAADRNGDGRLDRGEAVDASLVQLFRQWDAADRDGDGTLSPQEYAARVGRPGGAAPSFGTADVDSNGRVGIGEARSQRLDRLVVHWQQFDENDDTVLSRQEYQAFRSAADHLRQPQKIVGQGQFNSPETALWDAQADVYLVSNVNGSLTGLDGNGFISRVAPDGTIAELKWIDGSQPGVTLNGPKGMTFAGSALVVADVKSVRFFDRVTGEPVRAVMIPDAYMLNDPAVGSDGSTVYVTDTGSETGSHSGAVYRIDGAHAAPLAHGPQLDRPDGLIGHDQRLLVTPFGAHARTLYTLDDRGRRQDFASVPGTKLDGLIRFPDGSFGVTSWQREVVYRVRPGSAGATVIAGGLTSPAQIDYDTRRERLIVPLLQKHEVRFYDYAVTTDQESE